MTVEQQLKQRHLRYLLAWFTAAAALVSVFSIFPVDGKQLDQRSADTKRNLRVVRVKLAPGMELRPALAKGGPGRSEMFPAMMNRLHPYAAINGTFYSTALMPLGDVVIDGQVRVRGKYPNAMAQRKDGRIAFVRRRGDRFDWSGYRSGLAAGPMLIRKGRISLDPIPDGFSRKSLEIVAARSGIGLTRTGELLLVVSLEPVTLQEFAEVMLGLGAVDAINLDGGPACGLYDRGRTVVEAALPMTNVLVVYKRD